ncbi:hypothetical protein [Methylotetracoccus oryzae]|uniref:hypothetical protein n=1 Tax=Methylotetracoccus oryzae TaxID=1919059 RepID=UPI0011180841|nr:hypothetical protein [Methylotetracoccus oryzae]
MTTPPADRNRPDDESDAPPRRLTKAVRTTQGPLTVGVAALGLMLALTLAGCSWIGRTGESAFKEAASWVPGNSETGNFDPVELQEDLLRYADNLSAAAITAADQLRLGGKPIDKAELLQLRVYLGWDILTSATGASALGNLIDLLFLTSAGRMRVQDYWMPQVYGSSATAMLDAFRTREATIWALAEKALRPEHCAELRQALNTWRRERSAKPSSLPLYASVSLVDEVTKAARRRRESVTTSVFALLDLDPLAGLDPATRELAQTRLFAERALFIGQRMPQLLQWQAELLTLQAASVPEVRQLVANSTQLAASGDRLSRTIEQAPALISAEREHILAALKSQEGQLAALSHQLGVTLASGTRMADATNGALKTFRDLTDRFQEAPNKPKDPSEPFRIKDYAETAAEITRMSQQLQLLLAALEPAMNPENFAALSSQAEALTERTQARATELVNHAYRMALQWVGFSAGIVLAAALAYRYASTRLTRAAARQAS